ncbi:MAG: hypothetical protein N4J56_004944 [Chroococcidiopsis sp. SAG 2025]|uniref:ATP-binding protein n=1 Tax=Chroococcidiopsis sp. SAG 2025 TaxID=171389 RepID=UPI002937017C|nr:hypothetical protein [Chroococcidiopsis sp. SAG 2025]MDV2995290.1 hypothetical protein [Chroococcidiopsis sp. SAG 2025]
MKNLFSLDNLAIVNEKSLSNTADALWEALQSSLILPLSQTYKIPLFTEELEIKLLQVEDVKISYKFLHDRVQQAAYSLIPEEKKQETHLQIGRLLLQKTSLLAIEDNIFDIVNQLNIGIDLIAIAAEREQLASLNLIAGRRAKAATAYEAALRYLDLGISLLPENSWHTDYELTLSLYAEAVEVAYLNTEYAHLKTLSDLVLKQAKRPLDKVKVYETKIQFHIAQNQMLEAIATALEILKMLGVSLPEQPNRFGILVNSISTKLNIGAKQIEDLAQLPRMTDPEKIAAMRILIAVLVPAFLTTPNLFPIITFKMVNLSLRYGNSPQAAYGYALYGWLLCGALGDINSGYQFGQLALELLNKFNAQDLSCKVINIYNAFVCHWKEHGKTTIPAFVEALQMSLEIGNIEYAGYSSLNFCHYTFLIGEHLESVISSQKPYIELMHKLKQEYVLHSINTVRQTVLNLLSESADPRRLVGRAFNEAEMLPIFQAANIRTSLFMSYFYKTIALIFI